MTDQGDGWEGVGESLGVVPIFALPNVVLFPRAVLPLHIFEERYKAMTADVLKGDKRVAMALLKPGWEKDYYQRPAIEPVVCVGQILAHEKLADGTYNFLLQGEERAAVVDDVEGKMYRRAHLRSVKEMTVLEIDLSDERQQLVEIFTDTGMAQIGIARRVKEMFSSPLGTAEIADLIAFNMVDDVNVKQELLAQANVKKRVARVIDALAELRPMIEAAAAAKTGADPSMN